MKKIMVTGAAGQIGSELVPVLKNKYGDENVIATDIIKSKNELKNFEIIDVINKKTLSK